MDKYLSAEDSWRGRFWLPGRPEGVQRGVLTYGPNDGLQLTLIGGFDDAEWEPTAEGGVRVMSARVRRWPLMHGIVGNTPVTLVDCRIVRSSSFLFRDEVSEQEIRASLMLLGVFLKDGDGAQFSEMSFQIENLTEWDYRSDVIFGIEYPSETRSRARWDIKVDQVDKLSVEARDGLTIELHRGYRRPTHDVRRDRLEASTYALSFFKIIAVEPKSIDFWFETAHHLQDLITLAMDSPCAMLAQSVVPSPELKDDREVAAREKIDVYTRHTITGDPDAAGVPGRDAIFTLGVKGVNYEDIMPRWFEIRHQFKVACDMTLSLIYASGGYVESKLVTAVAAAEAFHEALGTDPPIPAGEFKDLKKRLKAAIPSERHKWLSEKVGRNNHTLRERLVELASRPDSRVMETLIPNVDGWADAAKNARNVVAHGGEAGSDVELIYAITEVTIAVVIVNLMYDLGIPADRLIEMIETNGRLERAARLATEKWPAGSA